MEILNSIKPPNLKFHEISKDVNNPVNNNPSIIIMVTPDIVEKGIDASVIAKQSALNIKGGGGGQAESAQAGGREAGKLGETLSMIPDIVSEALKR